MREHSALPLSVMLQISPIRDRLHDTFSVHARGFAPHAHRIILLPKYLHGLAFSAHFCRTPQGVREFRNGPFFGKYRSGIRENDFVRDSGIDDISFENSGKSKCMFGKTKKKEGRVTDNTEIHGGSSKTFSVSHTANTQGSRTYSKHLQKIK